MRTSTDASVGSARRPRRLRASEWALLAALLGAAAVIGLLPSASRQIWSQDEARMVLLADDALRRGGQLPALVRDQPYLNKPPLFFWSIALVAWPGGHVSDRVAAIPAVAASLATMLGAFALGRRLSSPHTGFVAMAVLATAPGFFLHGHEILPDGMFAAWLTWALYFLVGALADARPRAVDLAGFYLCVAGALWTKGLPALMAIPAMFAAALASAGARHLLRLRPLIGGGFVLLTALAWAVPYARTPGAERSQSVGAAYSIVWYLDRYRHLSSIPFGDGLLIFLPWTLWLIPAAVWWRLAPDRDAYRPVLAWMLVLLFLIGLSVQQRSRYLLPVYPLLALFVAASVTGAAARARPLRRLEVGILWVCLAFGAIGGVWLVFAPSGLASGTPLGAFIPDDRATRALLAALAVAAPALGLRELLAGRSPARAVGWIAGALALGLLVEAFVYPARLAAQYPVRNFAEQARAALDPSAPLWAYPDANLSFDVYLDRPVVELTAPAEVARRLEAPAAGGLLLRGADWNRWRASAHPTWCPAGRAVIGLRSFALVARCR